MVLKSYILEHLQCKTPFFPSKWSKSENENNFQNTKKEEDNVAFGVRKKRSLTSIFLFCSLSVVNVYEVEAAAEEEDDDSSLSRYCDYLNSSLAINLFLEFLLLKISGELSLYLPSDLQLVYERWIIQSSNR
ncbi:hypothetical protein YC2023_032068 [Brassica napus]